MKLIDTVCVCVCVIFNKLIVQRHPHKMIFLQPRQTVAEDCRPSCRWKNQTDWVSIVQAWLQRAKAGERRSSRCISQHYLILETVIEGCLLCANSLAAPPQRHAHPWPRLEGREQESILLAKIQSRPMITRSMVVDADASMNVSTKRNHSAYPLEDGSTEITHQASTT